MTKTNIGRLACTPLLQQLPNVVPLCRNIYDFPYRIVLYYEVHWLVNKRKYCWVFRQSYYWSFFIQPTAYSLEYMS